MKGNSQLNDQNQTMIVSDFKFCGFLIGDFHSCYYILNSLQYDEEKTQRKNIRVFTCYPYCSLICFVGRFFLPACTELREGSGVVRSKALHCVHFYFWVLTFCLS